MAPCRRRRRSVVGLHRAGPSTTLDKRLQLSGDGRRAARPGQSSDRCSSRPARPIARRGGPAGPDGSLDLDGGDESGRLPWLPRGPGRRARTVALAQWQSTGLWLQRLRVRPPQATPSTTTNTVAAGSAGWQPPAGAGSVAAPRLIEADPDPQGGCPSGDPAVARGGRGSDRRRPSPWRSGASRPAPCRAARTWLARGHGRFGLDGPFSSGAAADRLAPTRAGPPLQPEPCRSEPLSDGGEP